MKLDDTALRLLVKSYASELLDRDQYLKIRKQILNKLSKEGHVDQLDLQNYMKIYQQSGEDTGTNKYSGSDWLIISLGLIAAATLALILFG